MRGLPMHPRIVSTLAPLAALTLASQGFALATSPQTTEDAQLFARDPEWQDWLGKSVAATEDLAVVGEPIDDGGPADTFNASGTVHLFARGANGWSWVQELAPNDLAPATRFGGDVAVADGVILVGAVFDAQFGFGAGAAYVFEQGPGGWAQVAKLVPPELERQDRLGESVALQGTTAVVCAKGDDDAGADKGAAYVYERGPLGYSLVQKLLPAAADDPWWAVMGMDCDLDGDVLVAGAFGTFGKAFVFERVGGVWTQTAALEDPTPNKQDDFGRSVAVEGDRIAVGEAVRDGAWTPRPGSVLIFERVGPPPGNWAFAQEVKAGNASTLDHFGQCVDLQDGLLLVGAYSGKQGSVRTGTAYLFEEGLAGWQQTEMLVPSESNVAVGFGFDVAIARSQLLVGVPGADPILPGVATGAVYVFDRPFGRMYCDAEPSSTGSPGTIGAHGSLAASAGALVLRAETLPPNEAGLFLVSRDDGFVAQPGGSAGNLCLGGDIGRFKTSLSSTGNAGVLEFAVDTGQIPVHPPAAILAGETWHFQAWFRDHDPQPTSNFTHGLRILFE